MKMKGLPWTDLVALRCNKKRGWTVTRARARAESNDSLHNGDDLLFLRQDRAAVSKAKAKPKFRMKTRCELWFGFGLESALRTITVSLAEAAVRSGALEFLSPC